MKLIFLLLISISSFAQAKKVDSVKHKTEAEIAASLVVVFKGQDQINLLLSALAKSDAPHNSVVAPLFDFINKQLNSQLPDSLKQKR